MGAQDKTERVLRDIHVLFSKAEPYNGSKRNVVIDKTKMTTLLKELNDCMYVPGSGFPQTLAESIRATVLPVPDSQLHK